MTNAEQDSSQTDIDGRRPIPSAPKAGLSMHGDPPPNVADHYADLLRTVPRHKRAGLIGRLSQGFYDDWRPSRREVADLLAVDLGLLTVDEYLERQRQRRCGQEPVKDFISIVLAHRRYN
jgi:hypothetical protein